jgi:hypothetical protein
MQNLLYHRAGANRFLTLKKVHAPLKINVKNLKPRSQLHFKKVAAPLPLVKESLCFLKKTGGYIALNMQCFYTKIRKNPQNVREV